jgi:tetratricopeptide (TPR) repeat protein
MLDAMREVARQAPDFAPAHSILSKHDAYLADGLPGQSQSLRKEAEQEARRALQIDPKDPDGFVTFGLLAPRLDYGQRERFFRQAIATDPSWPHANGFLGNVMSDIGRLDEALTLYQRAASANPQSLDWSDMVAVGLVRDGQAKKADEELARLNQLWPNRASLWETQLSSLIAQHRWPDALKLLNDVDGHQDTSGFPMKRYRAELSALTTHDPKAMAEARQQALLVAADNPQGAMNGLAFLGLIDDAFAIAQRYSPIRPDGVETPGFLFGPMTAALRRDPRFMTLANKFGLPQYWRSTGKWPDFCSDANLPYNCQQAAAKLTPIVAH